MVWFAIFTSDNDLCRTFSVRNDFSGRAACLWTECTQPGDRFSRSPFQQMYVRVLQNVLCRERLCISSFADASQVLIPMDGIFHVQLKNKHSASSKHPMDGILRALWRRCHPMDGKMKITSSAFTDQPRLCERKHHSLQHHPCFRAMINLQPRIRRPRCYSSRANGIPVAPATDSKRHVLLPARADPSANFFARPSTRTFPFRLDFDL